MPRHTKVHGKERLDKYYKLAKEQGLRARSAFKLAQLDRRFGFLKNARVLLDLGAAPGGWLQIAQKVMTVASTIIGVDLVPIRPIPGVKTIAGDFLSKGTEDAIRAILGERLCDVVLHDGSPNVSGAWDKDAYVQNVLVLTALRIATRLLERGGTFVTKIFRSPDYNKLMFVLTQLFTKCHATKPESSRYTSAEIYVVCVGFKAPKKVDPDFFNPKAVFAEIKPDQMDERKAHRVTLNTFAKPDDKKKKPKAVGYGEKFRALVYSTISATDFLALEDPLAAAGQYNAITFAEDGSEDRFKNSVFTTPLVLTACADLKTANRFDLKKLLKWHKAVSLEERGRQALQRAQEEATAPSRGSSGAELPGGLPMVSKVDNEITELEEELAKIENTKRRQAKRKLRKVVDKKLRIAARGNFNPDQDQTIDLTGQTILGDDDGDDFNYGTSSEEGSDQGSGDGSGSGSEDADDANGQEEQESSEAEEEPQYRSLDAADFDRNVSISKAMPKLPLGADASAMDDIQYGEYHTLDKVDPDEPSSSDDDDEDEDAGAQFSADPTAVTEKEPLSKPRSSRVAEFYDRMDQVIHEYRRQSKLAEDKDDKDELESDAAMAEGAPEEPFTTEEAPMAEDSSDSSSDEEAEVASMDDGARMDRLQKEARRRTGQGPEKPMKTNKVAKTGFESVPAVLKDPDTRALVHAMGAKMLDKRNKRDLLEHGLHRWCFNDDSLPSWFVSDEQNNYFRTMPLTQDDVNEERRRFRELNSRPARKVLEALMRKRKKAKRIQTKILQKEKDKTGNQRRGAIPSVRQLIRGRGLNRSQRKFNRPIDRRLTGEKRTQRLRDKSQARKTHSKPRWNTVAAKSRPARSKRKK
eukprot:RCo002541